MLNLVVRKVIVGLHKLKYSPKCFVWFNVVKYWQGNKLFNVHESVHRNNIIIYIQQDATLHSLFYPETTLHVSRGTITHHQERNM